MKKAEAELNSAMMASGDIPMEIHTRIGINTGSMVVGNMGTDNKMNYTIMGNDVNLAARLEGVNKQYGTWILVSEETWNDTDNIFAGRKLDLVRVVGINKPVQLYNILDVYSDAPPNVLKLCEYFNQAVDAYQKRQFKEAYLLFDKCLKLDPEDKPSRIFINRINTLIKEGIPENWTGVINLTSK
ncbi:adenylate/guanylate cyclase domain-containing protein [Brucepastera parasyntrophica]|uniref:adenylate/guanylate cyclase domain-containing protein n=1 Tax=Brucepastera parasyntrophica TaxID=2880008 RepID=UPI003F72B416